MSKNVWRNTIERDAWVEKNCRVCCQPDEVVRRISGTGPGCPHLARGDENKLPTPWTLRRNAVIGETYRCAAFTDRAPTNRRGSAPADTPPMFDELEPDDRNLIPVEGWPDYRAEQRKSKTGEHQ